MIWKRGRNSSRVAEIAPHKMPFHCRFTLFLFFSVPLFSVEGWWGLPRLVGILVSRIPPFYKYEHHVNTTIYICVITKYIDIYIEGFLFFFYFVNYAVCI